MPTVFIILMASLTACAGRPIVTTVLPTFSTTVLDSTFPVPPTILTSKTLTTVTTTTGNPTTTYRASTATAQGRATVSSTTTVLYSTTVPALPDLVENVLDRCGKRNTKCFFAAHCIDASAPANQLTHVVPDSSHSEEFLNKLIACPANVIVEKSPGSVYEVESMRRLHHRNEYILGEYELEFEKDGTASCHFCTFKKKPVEVKYSDRSIYTYSIHFKTKKFTSVAPSETTTVRRETHYTVDATPTTNIFNGFKLPFFGKPRALQGFPAPSFSTPTMPSHTRTPKITRKPTPTRLPFPHAPTLDSDPAGILETDDDVQAFEGPSGETVTGILIIFLFVLFALFIIAIVIANCQILRKRRVQPASPTVKAPSAWSTVSKPSRSRLSTASEMGVFSDYEERTPLAPTPPRTANTTASAASCSNLLLASPGNKIHQEPSGPDFSGKPPTPPRSTPSTVSVTPTKKITPTKKLSTCGPRPKLDSGFAMFPYTPRTPLEVRFPPQLSTDSNYDEVSMSGRNYNPDL